MTDSLRFVRLLVFTGVVALFTLCSAARAQTPPEISFIYPPSAAAGSTIDVKLGGYDWTPDMQIFVQHPGVKIELTGPPGPVLVPEPPYWFGKRARGNDLPLPREFPARLSIAADVPPGIVLWQAANANGATVTGKLLVTGNAAVLEEIRPQAVQQLPALPAAVVGRVTKLEEIDRYQFVASRAGPVTLDLWSRRLGTQMNAIVEVHDAQGRLIVDAADTSGDDLQITFPAAQGAPYVAHVYDADFRGHHSFVYRLAIHEGPRVVAASPAAGTRGQTRPVEFVGYGIATGAPVLEVVTQPVPFPGEAGRREFEFILKTAHGDSLPFTLGLSDFSETLESGPALPGAVTGTLDTPLQEDRFTLTVKQGERWALSASTATQAMPLDLTLTVLDPAGKEIARADDGVKSTNPALDWTAPADGAYSIVVADQSGLASGRAAAYRLVAVPASAGFTLQTPEMLPVVLGGKASLAVKITRVAGYNAPVKINVSNLPAGVSLPPELVIAADKSELAVEFTAAADAASTASLGKIEATGEGAQPVSQPLLVALTMKPRLKLTPEGLDDVRKWPRGGTFPAPVLIERLEGFTGELVLEQTAHQQRVRQGLTGPDFPVAASATRVEYPVFLPEWLETTKTSRIILNGVAIVPDPKGTPRHLLQKMELRIGMLPVGSLLKLAHSAQELTVTAGQPFEIPVSLTRAQELKAAVTLELRLSPELEGKLQMPALELAPETLDAQAKIVPVDTSLRGEHEITLRATAQYQGSLPVVSETTVTVEFTAP